MKKLLLGILAFLVLWEAGFWYLGVRPVSPWTLQTMLYESKKDPLVVDVRTRVEYEWFHIPDALRKPEVLYSTSALGGVPGLAKDDPIVVVCMTGHRSSLAALHLKGQGYTNVSSLTGGMAGWFLTGHMSVWNDQGD